MGDDEFCVVCGATGRPLREGVCPTCDADRTVLVSAPRRGTVVICPHCGAREVRAHWERAGASELLTAEDLVPFLEFHPDVGLRRTRWEETAATANQREYLGRAEVVYRDVARTVEVPLTVRLISRSCPECSRKSGKYYTAVLQLRGPAEGRPERPVPLRERLDRTFGRLMREGRADWRKAFSWREERPEGWDCFFTDTLAARSFAKLAKQHLGASVKESASLVGRRHGQDVYRVTFCLRFARPAPTGPTGGPDDAAPARVEP